MATVFLKAICVTVLSSLVLEYTSASGKSDSSNTKADDTDALLVIPAPECDLYLAPSAIPGLGRGIIAGKHFTEGTLMETLVTLAVNYTDIAHMQLGNYVYDTNEDQMAMAEFGIGMLYNHMKNPSITSYWMDSDLVEAKDQMLAHTTFNTVEHKAIKDIAAADEIFCYYGDDKGDEDWFAARGIVMAKDAVIDVPPYSLEEIKKIGHCLSYVEVRQSSLPFAGNGLFSKKDFKKGEIVTVSPSLLLPKDDVARMGEFSPSVIQNYCIASPNSSYVFFPIGYSPLINHGMNGYENLEPELFWWEDSDISEKDLKLNSTLETLSQARFAQLDIAYRATRDIAMGEEFFYDYGIEWLNAWSTYLAKTSEHLIYKMEMIEAQKDIDIKDILDVSPMPKFSFFIGASDGLFVPAWDDELLAPIVDISDCNGDFCAAKY